MDRKIIETLDGSPSLWWEEIGEHYHSTKGARQESQHIFIGLGMQALAGPRASVDVFEMGLGTGLNALLALMEGLDKQIRVNYTTLELYPLNEEEVAALQLPERVGRPDLEEAFQALHAGPWGEPFEPVPGFVITKHKVDLNAFEVPENAFDCVFFDAFSPNSQPDLWSEAVFERMYAALRPGGNLTTYCAKGAVKRAMRAAGFKVEAHPGPPGKREVTRALKLMQ